MKAIRIAFVAGCAAVLFAVWLEGAEDVVNRFHDHGAGVPVSAARGMAATVNGAGRNVVVACRRG